MSTPKDFDFQRISILSKLFSIALILFISSENLSIFQLQNIGVDESFLRSLLRDLCIAFIVAAIAICSIEGPAKMRLENEIVKLIEKSNTVKLLKDLFGSELRFKGIASVIQDERCQRTNMKLELVCQLNSENTIIRRKYLSYNVSHALDRSVQYSLTSFDKYTDEDKQYTYIEMVRIGKDQSWNNVTCFSPNETADKLEIINSTNQKILNGETILLKRIHLKHFVTYNEFGEMNLDLQLLIPPNEEFKCMIQSVGVTPLPGSYEFLNSSVSENLTVSVTYPQNLKLAIKALHPQKNKLEELFSEELLGNIYKQSWLLPVTILPYWGISLKYSKSSLPELSICNENAQHEKLPASIPENFSSFN